MIEKARSLPQTYGIALLASVLAFLATQASPLRNDNPFVLLLAAVLVGAMYGGPGPGLLATIISLAAGFYFVLGPRFPLRLAAADDVLRLGSFAVVALFFDALGVTFQRARQVAKAQAREQAAVAELGRSALTSRDLSELLDRAATLLCQSLGVEYAGIMQVLPDKSLLLKAGCGWPRGLINQVVLSAGTGGPASQAFLSEEHVIFRDFASEPRFSAKFLVDQGVASGMSVKVRGPSQPFGVVGVFTRRRRRFASNQVAFLQSFADVLADAVEGKQAEAQLREQSERLRVTLSSIGDAVIVTDPKGAITFINRAAQSMTGWTHEDALSRPLDQVFQLADARSGQPLVNPAAQVLLTGADAHVDHHAILLTRTGSSIPIGDSAAPMFDDTGQLIGTVLVFRDITAQQQNEQAIRQSEERFRVALKDSPVVVFNQDLDLRYTWVHNPARGFPNPSALGKTDADFMPQVDAVRWTEIKRGVLESGAGTREELFATVDGQRRAFDLTVEPLRNSAGSVVGITCASIDITERKREQAAIARLAALVESSEDAIIGKTLDGIILSWNPAAERLYGRAADDVIGQSISILYPPDRLDEFHHISERLKQGEPIEQHDTVHVRQDGKRIDVSVSVSLVRDSMGRVIGAATIARDITQRKRMEALQRFRAEASALLGSSLEYETTLAGIARLAVPGISDWCAVYLQDEDGMIRPLAVAHADPQQVARAQELLRRYPPDPKAEHGVTAVIRTGRPEFIERLTDEQRVAAARDPEHLKLLVDMGLESYMIVPLTVHKRTFGAMLFVSAGSGRYLTSDDLALTQDLANRAALSVENSRLFQALQQANEELERRVVQRTIELQAANTKLQEEIGERQRTNEQLRQLAAHLQSAREEERTKVAREIHDELGQVLTAVKIDLALLSRNLAEQGQQAPVSEALQEIASTSQLVDETIAKMREIIRELRPEILDHLGLRAAIEWQAQEFQTRTGIECEFRAGQQDPQLDLDRSTAIFRILQEALTNVARHAQATHVDVRLESQDGQLVLEVHDNGKGITPGEISNKKSFGILGMQERALIFGGQIELRGEPGQGTTVRVEIPLEGHDD